MKDIPQLFLFNQNRRTCLGAITGYTELTEDIRFNACSEISFTLPREYYNPKTETMEINPMYDSIEKHKLLFFTDNTEYYTFPPRKVGDSNYYKYKSSLAQRSSHSTLRFSQNPCLEHFTVQDETELFDVGGSYSFQHFHRIGDSSYGNGNVGGFVDYSNYHWGLNAASRNPFLAEEVFIPVSASDTIAYYTGKNSNDYPYFKWRVATYTDCNASNFIVESDANMWHIDSVGSQRINVSEKLPSGGFIRVWLANSVGSHSEGSNYVSEGNQGSSGYSYNLGTGEGFCYWTPPVGGYFKIFSGERRCTSVDNVKDGNDNYVGDNLTPKMRWFVIASVDEEDDGISCKKTVSAYSYEYTLSNTTFSLSEDTLPLYIPNAIINLVNSDNWIRDCINNSTSRSRQFMRQGVLNELLSYLPNWTIGYVSSSLMTTYRALDSVDNIDVYSYLMDTIQSTYNCFIVFDNENMTISAYSLSDINNMKTNMHLTWDNSIKKFSKTNMDSSYFTALRVIAGDDTYGVGLVNPTGNGMTYNFDRILPELNYTLAGAGTYERSLSDAVASWVAEYNDQYTSTLSTKYQAKSKQLIEANMALIKAESALSTALSDYLVIRDEINTMMKSSSSRYSYLVPEIPESGDSIKSGDVSNYYNATMQIELANAAYVYANAKSSLTTAQSNFESAKTALRDIAKKLTMNYSQALAANNNNEYAYSSSTTLLSAAEIKEIGKYIIEGSWNYENAAFSDTYSANDIYDMLHSVLSEAIYDLKNRLAIANFDFTIDSTNVLAIPEFDTACKSLRMGHQVFLHVGGSDGVLSPMLLAMHINYKDPTDFEFTFTTDVKRRPIQFRFADLYSTISQTSVTDKSFTFDT